MATLELSLRGKKNGFRQGGFLDKQKLFSSSPFVLLFDASYGIPGSLVAHRLIVGLGRFHLRLLLSELGVELR